MKPPPVALSFRAREPADDDFIEAVGREAFARWVANPELVIRYIAAEPEAHTEIAVEAGKRVGFVVVRFELPNGKVDGVRRPLAARIDAIAVQRGARGRGIGGALLARAESLAQRRGAQVLSLATAERNRRALRLFTARGFIPLLIWARGYSSGEAGIELFKPLLPHSSEPGAE